MPRTVPMLLAALLAPSLVCADEGAAPTPVAPAFEGAQLPLPAEVAETMKKHSWRDGCPLPLEGLSYLEMSYWGFDGKVHQGKLIVDAAVAVEVLEIFRDIFKAKFPIEKMNLIDAYQGSDDKSMEDNNTSAFNCRWMTGRKGVFSKHSYGRAIDINPVINPYISRKSVEPAAGKAYVDRTKPAKGIVVTGDAVVTAFKSRGWIWGGDWRSVKDYQHFEKKKSKK